MTEKRYGRIPPNSEDSEKGLIGAILLDPTPAFAAAMENSITPESFYAPQHEAIFKAIKQLMQCDNSVDLISVKEKLIANKELDQVGGEAYLEEVIAATPTATSAGYYAGKIKETQMLRNMITFARHTESKAFDPAAAYQDILSSATSELGRLAYLKDSAKTNLDAIVEKFSQWRDPDHNAKLGLPLPPWFGAFTDFMPIMRYGKMYTVEAGSGVGKSTFARNLVRWWAVDMNVPTGLITIEMDHEEVIGGIICEMAEVNQFSMDNHRPDMNPEGFKRIDRARKVAEQIVDPRTGKPLCPLYINDQITNADELELWANLMVRKNELKVIVLDYFQILDPSAAAAKEQGWEKYRHMVNQIRRIAKKLNVILVVLSQVTDDGIKTSTYGTKQLEHAAFARIKLFKDETKTMWAEITKHRVGVQAKCTLKLTNGRFTNDEGENQKANKDDGRGEEPLDTGELFNEPER